MYEFTTSGPIATAVRMPDGNCRITAGAPGATVQVQPGVPGRTADRRAAAGTTVTFDRDRLTVRVPKRAGWRPAWGRGRGRVRVEIGLPTDSRVAFDSGSAGLDVHGRISALKVDTGSGEILAEHVGGDVSVGSSSGAVRLGLVDGDVTLSTGSGDLRVEHVTGSVRGNSSSGDTDLGTTEGDVDISAGSGSLHIGTARGGTVRAGTSSGRVTVGVQEGVGVRPELRTSSGTCSGELVNGTPAPSGGRELTLRISTASGDIDVHRAAGHPSRY
jgi:hypothetical protein